MIKDGSAWVLSALMISGMFLLCALSLPRPVLALNESTTTRMEASTQVSTSTSATVTVIHAPTHINEPPIGPNDLLTNPPNLIPVPPYPMEIPDYDDPLLTELSLTPMAVVGILAVTEVVMSFDPKKLRRIVPLPVSRPSGHVRIRRP